MDSKIGGMSRKNNKKKKRKTTGTLGEKRAVIDRSNADNTRLWKIRIVICRTGFRAVDIFRSIWSGNLNAQFENRSATQRPCCTAEGEVGGRAEGEEGEDGCEEEGKRVMKIPGGNSQNLTMLIAERTQWSVLDDLA